MPSATSPPGDSDRRAIVADAVEALLHDWIKYMEMRLTSIDWSAPPPDVERMLARSILELRHIGSQTLGVRAIWEPIRQQLLGIGDPCIFELVDTLDADILALEDLSSWSIERLASQANEVDQIIRRPGRRLRVMRAELNEEPG